MMTSSQIYTLETLAQLQQNPENEPTIDIIDVSQPLNANILCDFSIFSINEDPIDENPKCLASLNTFRIAKADCDLVVLKMQEILELQVAVDEEGICLLQFLQKVCFISLFFCRKLALHLYFLIVRMLTIFQFI